ncbi:aldehyde oxidase GLOX-like [Andrographis paniculata]|uniref:aldehyde oxidase GLOX-like n=1 Tax=Andrographis paniculata TaxID=175694 RepID=UPI0021E8DC60|nr:aldehyde oxidase GLOX-like [Andrographis paniculata]
MAIFKKAASLILFLTLVSLSVFALAAGGGGEWKLLHRSVGVSAMHMQLLHNNKVIIYDRTDFGESKLKLPPGKCRSNDDVLRKDCTAHSLLYDVVSNTYRPLMVHTDFWCSSGAVMSDGTLIQTGGFHAGDRKIRLFSPCDDDQCDWVELQQNLTVPRWYSSDHILPDGRVIIVGGRAEFSYEFIPKNQESENRVFHFPFLQETSDPIEENNLYPFLHLLPDGNLFVFANQRSVVLDYTNNKILRKFRPIPGGKRSYPSTGSSVMLPLRLNFTGEDASSTLPLVEVLVCGGARGGAFFKAFAGVYVAASESCGRLRVTDPDPEWVMEIMPMSRVMPDMLLLPTGDVIIINGAGKGSAGWDLADGPVLNPVLYRPGEGERFSVLNPTLIPRMYHSSATLLPDGRILVGGSNPHEKYNFTGVRYPTELSLESFSPPYLASRYNQVRPKILSVGWPTEGTISYGQKFTISFSMKSPQPAGDLTVTMTAPSFTTHSFAMNQRLLVLYVEDVQHPSASIYNATVYAPPTANIAPSGYYMVAVVHQGVPSHCTWVRIK